MLKEKQAKKALVLGAGPIVIGQGEECETASLQVVEVLNEEGCQVVTVNDNPAFLAADFPGVVKNYFEPLTLQAVKEIIEREQPDLILAAAGGASAGRLLYELKREGILDDNIKTDIDVNLFEKTQNPCLFREFLQNAEFPTVAGDNATYLHEAMELGVNLGFPVIVRTAFSFAGLGSGIAYNREELEEIVQRALALNSGSQITVERLLEGTEKLHIQVLRDCQGTTTLLAVIKQAEETAVCFGNALGWAMPLKNSEDYAEIMIPVKRLLDELKAVGSFQITLAVASDDDTTTAYILDVNPHFTRVSMLSDELSGCASAALGLKLALGDTISELGETAKPHYSTAEKYIVTMPLFEPERFNRETLVLDCSAKAIGEIMVVGNTSAEVLNKAFRALYKEEFSFESSEDLRQYLYLPQPYRWLYLREALKNGLSIDEAAKITKIRPEYLQGLVQLNRLEKELGTYAIYNVVPEVLLQAKQTGCSDRYLADIFRTTEAEVREKIASFGIYPCRQSVIGDNSCLSSLSYAMGEIESNGEGGVILVAPGANKILQGGEWDWTVVQAARALQNSGQRVVLIDPDGVSPAAATKYFARIYREPIQVETILAIAQIENITKVVLQFGGCEAIALSAELLQNGLELPDNGQAGLRKLAVSSYLRCLDAPDVCGSDVIGIAISGVGDGRNFVIAGVAEQIESTEVHTGDSACVLPPYSLSDSMAAKIKETAMNVANEMKARGWVTFYFSIKGEQYALSDIAFGGSSDIAYISRATETDWAGITALAALGADLTELGVIEPIPHLTAVKEAVFSFARFPGVDTTLGKQKRASGSVIGMDEDFGKAFIKAQLAAGAKLPSSGKIYVNVRSEDRRNFIEIAEQFQLLGFELMADAEMTDILQRHKVTCQAVYNVGEGRPNVLDMLKNDAIKLLINIPDSRNDNGVLLRRIAVLRGIPLITTLAGAQVTMRGLKNIHKQ